MKNADLTSYTKWRNDTLAARMETDKKYLVLKMGHHLISTAGLGWYVLYTLQGIRFGIENDYIPVVDWQNCKLPQYSADNVGRENVWEYFFEQPCGVDIRSAYASNDFFVLEDVGSFDYQNWLNAENFVNFYDSAAVEWRNYFQKYIRIKKDVQEYFKHIGREYVQSGGAPMIGVLARGTDYAELKPTGHLKPILPGEIFEHIDRQGNRANMFLATEDEGILRTFEERYPGRVLSVNAKRYENSGNNVLNNIYKDEDGYKRDLNYLYSLYMISRCPIGIYSACGGSVLASLMRVEEGIYYQYLCYGHNRPKGIIVGSYLEKAQGDIVMMGDKPIMFYVLNLLKLLFVEETDIIVSEKIKQKYKKLIGFGEEYGIKINYIVSDDYDVVKFLADNIKRIETAKTVLLYADYFVHGKDIIKEMIGQINTFDGACAWEGRYIFDYELKNIVCQLMETKKHPALTDILNEYIDRKKLFFWQYKRGVIYTKIEDKDALEKISQTIRLLEDLQGQKIGDFESFRKRK